MAKLDPAADDFPTEVLAAQIGAILDGWSEALTGGIAGAAAMAATMAEELWLTPPSSPLLEPLRLPKPLAGDEARFQSAVRFARPAAELAFAKYFHEFTRMENAHFEVFGIEAPLAPADRSLPARCGTDVAYSFVGAGPDGRSLQRNGTWKLNWERRETRWQLTRFEFGTETRCALSGRRFEDITSVSLDRHSEAMLQLDCGTDHWRTVLDAAAGVDLYGNNGIAAGDIDQSGKDSFYVCQPTGLPNRLFRNRGDGTFEDVTERSGTGLLDGTASAIFADFENRGLQDLLVVRSEGPLLFRNAGGGRFEVKREAFRFAREPQGTFTSAAVADYNRDGLLDVYLCVYSYYRGMNQYQFPSPYYDAQNGPPNFLFRNRGDGTFEDVTAPSGMEENNNRFSFAAEWIDFDGSGFPYLYVANDFGRKNLYQHQADGTFRDIAHAAGTEDYGPGMSVCNLDADGDGRLDLYVANMWLPEGKRITEQKEFLPGVPESTRALYRKHNAGNSLYCYKGGGSFVSAGEQAGVARGGWSWSCAAWDALAAGRPDLYVANGFISGSNKPDLQSFFWRQVAQHSMGNDAGAGAYEMAWNAVNELARSDWSWSGFQRNAFFLNVGGGKFVEVAGLLQLDFLDDSRAYALADIDGDGRVEILLKNRTGPQLRVLRNSLEGIGDAISFRFRGTKSNRDGIGVLVTVEVDGAKQCKQLSAGSGFASQHAKELFFGVGHGAAAIQATVRWPSGVTTTATGLRTNTRVFVVEDDAQVRAEAFTPHPVERGAGPAPLQPQEAEAVTSAWLLEPLFGPALRIQDEKGSPIDLATYRGRYVLAHLVDRSCGRLETWTRALEAAQPELETLGYVVLLIEAAPQATDKGRGTAGKMLTADPVSVGAWAVQLRYLFDRRQELTFPTTLLFDREGGLVRVHRGEVSVQTLRADWQTLHTEATTALARALPYPGPYFGSPLRHDDFTFAVAFVQFGDLDAAQAAFTRVVQRSPGYAAAWFNLGTIYLNKKQYGDAEQCLRKATSLNEADSDAWNNLGLVEGEQQRYEAAVKAFQKAALANPNNTLALENMMRIYQFQARPAEAKQVLQQLLAKAPSKPGLHLALATAELALGDDEGGEAELQRAIQLRPEYIDARNDLGTFYLKNANYPAALREFEACKAIDPQFDRAVLNEAVLYRRTGEPEKAIALLQGFLQEHPGNRDVATMLGKLRSGR